MTNYYFIKEKEKKNYEKERETKERAEKRVHIGEFVEQDDTNSHIWGELHVSFHIPAWEIVAQALIGSGGSHTSNYITC